MQRVRGCFHNTGNDLVEFKFLSLLHWLSSRDFFQGANSIVMEIYFVMLMFLLFLDQISEGGQKPLRGENCVKGDAPSPPWKKTSCRDINIFIKSAKMLLRVGKLHLRKF